MRILQIVHFFPPEQSAGTERYTEALSRALKDRGHNCSVLAGSNQAALGPGLLIGEQDGLTVIRLAGLRKRTGLRADIFHSDAEHLVRRCFDLWRPDLVHLHHWLQLTGNLVAICAELGIPTVITLHDQWIACSRIHRVQPDNTFCSTRETPCASCVDRDPWQASEEVTRELGLRHQLIEHELRLADSILVPSLAQLQFLQQITDFPLERLQIVPLGSPLGGSPRMPGVSQRSLDAPLRVGYWGYLTPLKGPHLLLEAARLLPEQLSARVEWHLLGMSNDSAYLERLTRLAEGLPVTFHGPYQQRDVEVLGLDVAVFPSLCYETHSFVLDEAFRMGIPVMVSDRGAPADRIGHAGIAFATGDPNDLARQITTLLQKPDRLEELRHAVPNEGAVSMEAHAADIEKIYRDTVASHSRRKVPPRLYPSLLRHREEQLRDREQHLADRARQVDELACQVGRLTEDLADQQAKLRGEIDERRALQAEVAERDRLLAEQGDLLLSLRAELHARTQDAAALREQVAERDRLLSIARGSVLGSLDAALKCFFENANDALRHPPGAAQRSVGWRFLQWFACVRGHIIAPPGTRRGMLHGLITQLGGADAEGGVARMVKKTRKRLDLGATLDPYQRWLTQHAPTPEMVRRLPEEARTLGYQPTISIVMPVYNTDETWLRQAIESVRSQIYPNWELCICDDGSTHAHVREVLDFFHRQDGRIKIHFSAQNEGTSAASNHALDLATGEFVGFLDHDDELSAEALLEVARFLNAHPETDMVYTDEDKISPQGQRFQPFFKPDWSPDMLLSFMYTGHFSVYRRDLFLKVGGFDPAYDGSQDYDLALRMTEKARVVGHVPKVLYHWRVVPGSIAEDANNKPYAYEAGKRALMAALGRRESSGVVEDTFGKRNGLGFYRVRRTYENPPPVSIIIPTRDKVNFLARCIASIEKYTNYNNYEIVVVNNDSVEFESLQYLRQTPHRIIAYRGDFHFAKMMNVAAGNVSGDILLFLNNDTEVLSHEWLSAMVEHALRPEVGAVGAKLLYPNNTIQHAGVLIGHCEFAGHSHRHMSGFHHGYWGSADIIRNYSAVTAACMMIRRQVFLDAGGFDEAFQFAYQDVDLCLRLRERGFLIVYTPYAQLLHHESATRGRTMAFGDHDISLARNRWQRYLVQGDPYYNPNLTKRREDFSIALEGE